MDIGELKSGHYVRISVFEGFHRLGKEEPFDYETGTSDTAEFSTVASGASSGYKNIAVLEPDDVPPHLFWALWGVKDGCKYKVKVPTGTDRLGVDEDKDVGFVTNEKSPYFDPNPDLGFWFVNNWYPAVEAMNPTPVTLTPKVWFRGRKWDIIPVTDPNVVEKLRNFDRGDLQRPYLVFTNITVGGVETG